MKPLVETALLGHGLKSISNNTIKEKWPDPSIDLTWVEDGKIIIGKIDSFLAVRNNSHQWKRFDGQAVTDNRLEGNGLLTASGTMAVGQEKGYDIVVSCGLGGIGDIKDEPFCYDLHAIAHYKIPLLATAFKDMIDYRRTFEWLYDSGARVAGYKTNETNGYLFQLDDFHLHKKIDTEYEGNMPDLILNPIEPKKRLSNLDYLNRGIEEGKNAVSRGHYYHPAVNGYFDHVSEGSSSLIQLESLINNIEVATML